MYSLQYSHGISHLQSPSIPSNLSLNPDVEPYCLLLRLSIVTLLLAVWCYRGFWLVCPQTTRLNIDIYIYNDRPKNKLSDLHLKFSVWVWSVSFILILPWLSSSFWGSASTELGRRSFDTDRIKPRPGPETLDPNTHEPQINQSDWIGLLKLYSAESYNQFTSSITSV